MIISSCSTVRKPIEQQPKQANAYLTMLKSLDWGNDTCYVDGTYFLYFGEGAQALAEKVFGSSIRPGVTFTPQELSRKQIVPLLMEAMK